MNDVERWQESNNRQLGSALAKLRQRLERYVEQESAAAPLDPAPEEAETAAAMPAPDAPEELPSALTLLSERLGLSPFEQNILLLCAAMEFDTRIASLCARAHGDSNKAFPTFGLALGLFDAPAWDALSPERPLRYWRLLEIHQPAGQSLTASPLRADERIVNYLKGLNYLDDRVSGYAAPLEIDPERAETAPSQAAVVENIVRQWKAGPAAGIVQLVGPVPASKQLVAHQAAAELNCLLCRLCLETFPSAFQDLEIFVRLWRRETRLLPIAFYLDAEEAETSLISRGGALNRFLGGTDAFCFIARREALSGCVRDSIIFEVGKPTAVEQQSAWLEELGATSGHGAARLASHFDLNIPAIRRLARRARVEAGDDSELLARRVWDICRRNERPQLDTVAQRLEPKVTWTDLVVPEAVMKELRRIAGQVRHRTKVYWTWGLGEKSARDRGISALFAGGSGTGKTMAAEVLAGELGLELYRIDLSSVVSKYIGETEKNLRRVFDAAEESGAILLFDEADALFGKRSEVKDSHDRYANIEVSYLLQRMETYRGLVILTTNLRSALDPAFIRRLRFIVDFPFPATADRRRLWEKVFRQEERARQRPAPPLEGLDYSRLARFTFTGGHIHNVAVSACFMAANADSKVTMPLVLEAARAEFEKLQRPINETEFSWREPDRMPVTANGHAALAEP